MFRKLCLLALLAVVILAVPLGLSLLPSPGPVMAAPPAASQQEAVAPQDTPVTGRELSVDELSDDVAKTYMKVYQQDKDTFVAEIFLSPIRFVDSEAKWQAIDNTIKRVTTEGVTSYSSACTPVELSFADSLGNGGLTRLQRDAYVFEVKPLETSQAAKGTTAKFLTEEPQTTAAKAATDGEGKPLSAQTEDAVFDTEKKYRSLAYKAAYGSDGDIVVTPNDDGIKYEIVFSGAPNKESFLFEIHVENLVLVKQDDNNVLLNDPVTGKTIGYMPAPCMEDSDPDGQAESYDIGLEVVKVDANTYTYKMTPSRAWLEDTARVYPVILDPSTTYHTGSDTFAASAYPSNHYDTDYHLKIGNSSDLGISRGYITIPLTVLPGLGNDNTLCYITSATLRAYQNYTGGSTPDIALQRVTSSVAIENITWNTKPTSSATNQAVTTVSAAGTWYSWDITSKAQWWLDNPNDPRQLCMKNVDEGPNMYKRFYSSNYSDNTKRPEVVLTYDNIPAAPTSVTVSPATSWTNGNITVAWSGVTADGTISAIQYSTTSATSGFANIGSTAASGSMALALPVGQKYVWVRAVDTNGLYGAVEQSATQYYRGAVPGAPTSVTVSPAASWTNGNITVAWSGVTSNLAISRIEYSTTSATTGFVTTGSTAASGSVSLALPVGQYSVWVRAVNAAGNGTAAQSATQYYRGAVPSVPTSVTVSPSATWTNGNITVAWSGVTSNLAISRIEYSTTSATAGFASIGSTATSGSVPLALPVGQNSVWVRAVNAAGNGTAAQSATQYYRDTTAPTGTISVTAFITDAVNMKCEPSPAGATDALSGMKCYQSSLSATSGFVDLTANTQITLNDFTSPVYVRAIDNAGNATAVVSVTPALAAPTALAARGRISNAIGLSWAPPASASVKYNIYRAVTDGTGAPALPDYTLLVQDVINPYYFDYDIQPAAGKVYHYKLATSVEVLYATQLIRLISAPSAGDICAYPVNPGIVSTPIGAKDYEHPFAFDLTSGSGSANPVSGNLLYQQSDVAAGLPVNDIGIERAYNSKGDYYTQFGKNWDFNYNITLLRELDADHEETAMLLKRGDGSIYRFVKSGNAYTRPAGFFATLELGPETSTAIPQPEQPLAGPTIETSQPVTTPDPCFRLTTKDRTVYKFNKREQLESITDRIGNEVELAYSESGNLTTVTAVFPQTGGGTETRSLILQYYADSEKSDLVSSTTYGSTTYYYDYSGTAGMNNQRISRVYEGQGASQVAELYEYNAADAPNGPGMLNKYTDRNGHAYDFTYSDADHGNKLTLVSDPTSHQLTVVYNNPVDGYFTVTGTKDGVATTQEYPVGSLVIKSEKTGGATTGGPKAEYDYNTDYQVTQTRQVKGSLQRTVMTTTYDGNGDVSTQTDAAGHETTYSYENDLPVQVVECAELPAASQRITHTTYNAAGQTTSSYVEGTNQKTFNYYDTRGNLIMTLQGVGADVTSKTPSEAEALYHNPAYCFEKTTYEYDSVYQSTRTVQYGEGTVQRVSETTYDPDNRVTQTDDGLTETTYEYDELGNTTSIAETDGVHPSGIETQYDNLGNATQVTEQGGPTTQTVYDNIGRVTTETKTTPQMVVTTATSYFANSDGSSYEIRTTSSGSDVLEKELTVRNPQGLVTLGGIVKLPGDESYNTETTAKTYLAGTILLTLLDYTETTFDDWGRAHITVDQTGLITESTYDSLDRVTSTWVHKGAGGETTSRAYDALGNVASETVPDGTVTARTYDKSGRVLTESVSKGSDSQVQATYAYDVVANGRLTTSVTDAKGRTDVKTVDRLGGLLQEEHQSKVTTYAYDSDGKLAQSTLTDPAYAGQSALTSYEYSGTKQSMKTYGTGHYVQYEYDSTGKNIVTEKVTTDNGSTFASIHRAYDADGHVLSEERGNGTAYLSSSPDYHRVEYRYSPEGRILEVKYNDADATVRGYDSTGKETTVSSKHLANGTWSETQNRTFHYTDGQLDYLLDNRGGSTQTRQTFTYNWKGRSTGSNYLNASQQSVEDYTLDYDSSDRIAEEDTVTNYGTQVTTNRLYGYDWLGRLTTEEVGADTITYTYDEVGNRLTMTNGSSNRTYAYNTQDQLTQVSLNGTPQETYTYDLSGNQITKQADGQTTTYEYDKANELTQVTNGQTVVATYTYDPQGQRLQKTVGTEITKYGYDGSQNLLYTKDGSGAYVEKNILNTAGSLVATERAGSSNGWDSPTTYWARLDSRGSVTNIVDASDAVEKSNTYDAYGNTTSSSETFISSFAYTGAIIDVESGLYYLNARYYDPRTGRFISQDSYRGGSESFWHLYAYCEGDPVNLVDPSGYATVESSYPNFPKPGAQDPLKITISGNTISITWYCKTIVDTAGNKVFSPTTRSAIVSAIKTKWSGSSYKIKGIKATVNTKVVDLSVTTVAAGQKYSNVSFINTGGTSRVGCGTWSRTNLGWMYLYPRQANSSTNYSLSDFQCVVAHEFGHIAGLADGYFNDKTKYYNSIMCDQFGERNGTRRASSLDVEKSLTAWNVNRRQYWY